MWTCLTILWLFLAPAHAGAEDLERPVVIDPLRTEEPAPKGFRKRRMRELSLSIRDGGHPPQVRYLKLVELADLVVDEAAGASDSERKRLELEAARLYGEALSNAPDHPAVARVMMVTGAALARNEKPDEALKVLEALIAAYPRSPYVPWAWALLGDLRFASKDMTGAADAYSKIPDSHPLRAWAHFRQAWTRYNVGDLDMALTSLIMARHIGMAGEDELSKKVAEQATKDAVYVSSHFTVDKALSSIEALCSGDTSTCKVKLGRQLAEAYEGFGQSAEAQDVRDAL